MSNEPSRKKSKCDVVATDPPVDTALDDEWKIELYVEPSDGSDGSNHASSRKVVEEYRVKRAIISEGEIFAREEFAESKSRTSVVVLPEFAVGVFDRSLGYMYGSPVQA